MAARAPQRLARALIGCAGALVLALPAPAHATAEATATEFLRAVQRGDLATAKRLLDGPQYRQVIRGGDDGYFAYESGEDPNLAFLVGHPFEIGPARVQPQRSDWSWLTGVVSASVIVPLHFAADRYRPLALPPVQARGQPMQFVDFMNFVVTPERWSADLTLRLRPSVEPGLIRPTSPFPIEPLTPGSLAPPPPRDAGPVLLPSGERLTPQQLRGLLPKVGRMTLELSIVRRGHFTSWGIHRFEFLDAVLVTERGEVRVPLR